MANVQKYKRGAVGHLFAHFERQKDEEGNYIKFKNQNIDTEKSDQNYNLHQSDKSQLDLYHDRLSEIKVNKRKDLNTMCSWVVTVPEELKNDPEKQKEFFKNSYDFLNNRYGKENCISAFVHMDEVTPHMHYSFIPVTFDAKKNIEKVSARDVVNLTDLKSFHTDLQNYMQQQMQMQLSIITEETKELGNKSVKELQAETSRQLAEQRAIASNLSLENDKVKKSIQLLKNEKDSVKKELEAMKDKKATVTLQVNNITKKVKGVKLREDEIKAIYNKAQTTAFGSIKGLTMQDLQNLANGAMKGARLEIKVVDLESQINQKDSRIEHLERQVPTIEQKIKETTELSNLHDKVKSLEKTLDFKDKVLDKMPKGLVQKAISEVAKLAEKAINKSIGAERER